MVCLATSGAAIDFSLDCEKIWEAISGHIRDSLVDEIGIKINKLGIFTLKRIELFVGRKSVLNINLVKRALIRF